jgi:hypothetical protein
MNMSAMYNFVLAPIGPPIKEHTIRTIFFTTLKCKMNSVAGFLTACYTKLRLLSRPKTQPFLRFWKYFFL